MIYYKVADKKSRTILGSVIMKTIKEITNLLKEATSFEPWMEEIKEDERVGVQKAFAQWKRKMEKQQLLLDEYNTKFTFDQSYSPFENAYIAGVDEAGRGPLAGPVVTASVILPNERCEALIGINDSKQLSKKTRAQFAKIIEQHAICYSVHFQSVEEIDRLNIFEATKQSMKQSIESLSIRPDHCLLDAIKVPIDIPQSSIIKGDAQSLAIGAASILAKHYRDEYMDKLHEQCPEYGFKKHAGYGTKQHLEAIGTYGITIHHRKSFEPIKSMIDKKEKMYL